MKARKLFVASDVHGHSTLFRAALDRAGFDPENEAHVFVSCGDLFDRGPENRAVYDFVRSLPRKVLVRGNHDDLLLEALGRGFLESYDRDNGTEATLREFLGDGAVDGSGRFDREAHGAAIRELTEFLGETVDYYETERYVFTHGWLPVTDDLRRPTVRSDWRTAEAEAWTDARWLSWHEFYAVGATLAGKTIVCGHHPSSLGRMFDPMREPDCSEPFFGDGVAAIDAYTVRSGRVNVIVLDEE